MAAWELHCFVHGKASSRKWTAGRGAIRRKVSVDRLSEPGLRVRFSSKERVWQEFGQRQLVTLGWEDSANPPISPITFVFKKERGFYSTVQKLPLIGSSFPLLQRRKSSHKSPNFFLYEFCIFLPLISHPFLLLGECWTTVGTAVKETTHNCRFLLINAVRNSGSFVRRENFVRLRENTHSIWVKIFCDVLLLIVGK